MKTASSKGSTKPTTKVMQSTKTKPGGIRNVPSSSVVKRSGKSKVRAVPDFSKLHQKWEKQLQQGKACTKKPCTKVEEFHLSTPGDTTECPPNVLNEVDETEQENVPTPRSFKPDPQALKSITSGKGLVGKTPTSRATLAGTSGLSRRVPMSEAANPKVATTSKDKKTAPKTISDPDKGEKGAVKFEADPNALQSILKNQGLTNGPQGVTPARQTLAAPQRIPIVGPNLPRPTDVVRRSIFTGPTTTNNRRQFYTEFTQRVVSRVAQSSTSSGSESPRPSFAKPSAIPPGHSTPTPVVTREKGSIYEKVKYFDRIDPKRETLGAASSWRTATPRTTGKAARVAVEKTPGRTPGTITKARRIPKDDVYGSSVKQPNPKTDKLVTHLKFQDEDETDKIQALEEAEKKLEAEIAARESTPLVSDQSSETDFAPPEVKKSSRVPFGILSPKEITVRSKPGYNPKVATKSTKESSVRNPCLRTPPKKPHGHMRYRDLPPSPSYRSPKFQRPQSPLVTSEKKARRKLSTVDPDTTMDILTVPAMDKSRLEMSLNDSNSSGAKSPKVSASWGKSPKVSLEYQVRQVAAALENSPFKENSPSKIMWDKENVLPPSPKGFKFEDLEQYKLDAALLALCSPSSKENIQRLSLCSPNKRQREEKTSPPTSPDKARRRKLAPKDLTNTEAFKKEEKKDKKKVSFEKGDDTESGQHDIAMESLSQELCETKSQIDNLNQKAMTHLNGEGSKQEENLLLKQIQEIQERQEQLLTLQLKLQSKLRKQSPTPSPASSDHVTDSPKPWPFPGNDTPSTPSDGNQSYADFIAAHVEDISPYVPDNSTSRMPFERCVGAERATKWCQETAEIDHADESIPYRVAQSVLDESPTSENRLAGSLTQSPAVFSPMPMLAGLHQLMLTASPAPIQTPLALRSMAGRVQPQRDLLEISSTESSMLETSKLFPTPEYLSDAAEQSVNLHKTPVRGPSGQVSSNSLMTTTLSVASPRSSPSLKHSKGSLSLAANLSPRLRTTPTVCSPSVQSPNNTTSVQRLVDTPRPISSPVSLSERRGSGLLQSTIFSQAVARFHNALLDEEVELYACRVADKHHTVHDARIVDPVALTLTHGDGMHFLPIEGSIQLFPSREGSAFTAPTPK